VGGRAVNGAPEEIHTPVMVSAVLEWIASDVLRRFGSWVVDGTLGAAGHARCLLEAFPASRLLGTDQDPEILERARAALEPWGDRVRVRRSRLSGLSALLAREGIERPAGVLFDLGASSLQLDRPERGFSFQTDGPLDMRMDPGRDRTAADVVNTWDEADLADLLYYEGGEGRSRRIAEAIVEARRRTPFQRTGALADVVAGAVGGRRPRGGRLHPATRSFQALRRAVNEEGDELLAGLAAAEEWLEDGGRLVVISFHSGEDGAVKRFFAEGARAGRWRTLTKRPVRPEPGEVRANRRARSARVRAAERIRTPRPGDLGKGAAA